MTKCVKSSEVITPNAVTKISIRGEVVARYAPTGPNKWDDYELTREEGDEIDVAEGTRIEVEPIGADPELRFKSRSGREVLVCRWVLTEEDQKQVDSGNWGVQEAEQASRIETIFGIGPKNDPRDDMHEYFLDVIADPIA